MAEVSGIFRLPLTKGRSDCNRSAKISKTVNIRTMINCSVAFNHTCKCHEWFLGQHNETQHRGQCKCSHCKNGPSQSTGHFPGLQVENAFQPTIPDDLQTIDNVEGCGKYETAIKKATPDGPIL